MTQLLWALQDSLDSAALGSASQFLTSCFREGTEASWESGVKEESFLLWISFTNGNEYANCSLIPVLPYKHFQRGGGKGGDYILN